jgi:asparagine synthase (glutamine-hydrolysing)
MCGIAGYINYPNNNLNVDNQTVINKMLHAIIHRGPDDTGHWISAQHNVVLGHRRLSIIDLTTAGHQPMQSSCGRYVLVFNGEIYNFVALRSELEQLGHKFSGHSDTEVVLVAVMQFGLQAAVERFNGMFAFALWDNKLQQLYLVRDRVGIKPLYYGWCKSGFLFGSELKALRAYPDFNSEIDRDVLSLYFKYNYIPAPYSIYKKIYKLLPGTILTIAAGHPDAEIKPVPYWSAVQVIQQPRLHISTAEATQQLEQLLCDAVKLRMMADVPLGAFLSGGIDSSLVVALMQQQSSQPVKTFSIGFSEDQYNEAEYAKAVADHLHTEHTELYVSPTDAMAVIPQLPILYDEPFADVSQIPTFLVSQLARQKVTVSLSGDGGDELFGGYNRYFWGDNIWRKIKYCPLIMRKLFAILLHSIAPQQWDKVFTLFGFMLPKNMQVQLPGDKIHKLANILTATRSHDLYKQLLVLTNNSDELVQGGYASALNARLYQKLNSEQSFIEQMMFWDMNYYLPDDILTKVDRASMGVSLEARVPLLDHRVVEFAWQLPLSMKVRNNQGKCLLREVLYQHVPRKLLERPKMGFGVPIGTWLRGSLREWAEDLLNEQRLLCEGYLNPAPIMQKWREHLTGKRNWQYHLWGILMFQSWLRHRE